MVAEPIVWCACHLNNGAVCSRHLEPWPPSPYCSLCGHREECHDHSRFEIPEEEIRRRFAA